MKNSIVSEDHMKPDFLKGDMNSEFFHEVDNVEKERTISYFSRMLKLKLREKRTSLLMPLNTIKTYLGQHLET